MPTFRPKEKEEEQNTWNVTLPIDVQWGVYARQSTMAQLVKNTQSTEMQTSDLIAWLVSRGINETSIQLFDADLGVSGTKRIDERTGLQDLVDKIQRGLIKAILVYQVSRLFRDETAVQYNVFADICKKQGCILVTADGMIFNFANPMHLKMFRFLAEMAAEYIPQQIGLLNQAKLRKARQGFYVGDGAIRAGFIVDYNKSSSTYRKFIVYKPHAAVTRSMFIRFYELEGDLSALCRELESLPVLYPAFEDNIDERIITRFYLKKVPGGYHITRKTIVAILTDPVNIGWWIVKGEIISRENHEPILNKDEEYLFWYSFSRLSKYTVEGEVNTKRTLQPRRFRQRATEKNEVGGLLKNRITGIDSSVYVHEKKEGIPTYAIHSPGLHINTNIVADLLASYVDDAFSGRLFEHLKSTDSFNHYIKYIEEEEKRNITVRDTITSQLAEIATQKKDIMDELLDIRRVIRKRVREAVEQGLYTSEEMAEQEIKQEYDDYIADFRKHLLGLDQAKTSIEGKLKELEEPSYTPQEQFYGTFHEELETLAKTWNEKPFKVKQEFVNLFVSKAVLSIAAPHWIQLDIYWSLPDWGNETLFIYRQWSSRGRWTEEDLKDLKEMYPRTSQMELLQRFPERSWLSISNMAHQLGARRIYAERSKNPPTLSWLDIQFTQTLGVPLDARSPIRVPLPTLAPLFGDWRIVTKQLHFLLDRYK